MTYALVPFRHRLVATLHGLVALLIVFAYALFGGLILYALLTTFAEVRL